MKDILIIIPSYKRQHKIEECVKAWRDTTSGKSDLLLVLESGDELYPAMEGILYMVGEFGSVGKAMNEAIKNYHGYKIIGHLNDDHLFRTKGWEERVIEALKNGGYAYGNDLLQGERLATQVFITRNIIDKLGYMALPELDHLYIDDYWMEMGRGINKLFYLDDVIIEHNHPGAGKAPMDEGYRRVNSNYPRALSIFNHWKETRKEADLAKLR